MTQEAKEGDRPLRILAFSAVDLSLVAGHALHVRGTLDALAARGHEVTLVTPRPRGREPATLFRRLRVPLLRFRVLGPWSFEALGGLLLLLRGLARRPDLLWTRQDLYTIAPSGVGSVLRIPVVVEINVSIPDELALAGRRSALRIAARCERSSLRRASAVVVLSPQLASRLAARMPWLHGRLHVAPIATHLPALAEAAAVRERLGIARERFVIGFAGNLTPIQGLDALLDAFARIDDPEMDLWIIGSGIEEGRLREAASSIGARARFFGALPREEADALLAACQVLVAPYRADVHARVTGGAVSTKVLTYLATDRPALLPDLPDYAPLQATGAISTYPAGDVDALSRALIDWAARWRAAGRPLREWPWPSPGPGRKAIEAWGTWDHRARAIESVVRPLLRGSR